MKKKLFRVAALSGSLAVLLKGQLRFMGEHYEVVGVASDGVQRESLEEDESIRTIAVNIERKINVWEDLVSLYKLYFLFKKEKPLIVHSITPKAGLLSMLAAYLAHVPHRLHTFTGLVFPARKGVIKKMLIFFDRTICFCATNIYPEGQGVKNDLIQYKITKKTLKIIGHGNVNGVDTSHYDPGLYDDDKIVELREDLKILHSDFVFLFVGRIGNDKGISELITSFVDIQKTQKDVKLILVGPYEKSHDPLDIEIEQEIQVNSDIITVGWRNDVRPFFALANVFILPSYREGFPNVVLQAGAMGKFSIVTDINGSNEIIQDGVNGKIIPARDSSALTSEMLDCVQNRLNYSKANLDYRKIIFDKYKQNIVWDAMLEEYRRLES